MVAVNPCLINAGKLLLRRSTARHLVLGFHVKRLQWDGAVTIRFRRISLRGTWRVPQGEGLQISASCQRWEVSVIQSFRCMWNKSIFVALPCCRCDLISNMLMTTPAWSKVVIDFPSCHGLVTASHQLPSYSTPRAQFMQGIKKAASLSLALARIVTLSPAICYTWQTGIVKSRSL